jgi:hypothetical protein
MHDMHGYSNLIFGCVGKHSAARGVRIHPPCEKLLIEFMVYFSYYDVTCRGNFSMGLMVLVSF